MCDSVHAASVCACMQEYSVQTRSKDIAAQQVFFWKNMQNIVRSQERVRQRAYCWQILTLALPRSSCALCWLRHLSSEALGCAIVIVVVVHTNSLVCCCLAHTFMQMCERDTNTRLTFKCFFIGVLWGEPFEMMANVMFLQLMISARGALCFVQSHTGVAG